jgi:multidrug efflux pump subunit AcrA (membrane-fusion protein)
VRPRLVALVLALLLAACGGAPKPAATPPRAATVRCGTAKVRVVEVGASIACTITLGDAVQKVTAEVKDLEGRVVVKG